LLFGICFHNLLPSSFITNIIIPQNEEKAQTFLDFFDSLKPALRMQGGFAVWIGLATFRRIKKCADVSRRTKNA
jgi:uncharacterized protein YggL (DUF469 family)